MSSEQETITTETNMNAGKEIARQLTEETGWEPPDDPEWNLPKIWVCNVCGQQAQDHERPDFICINCHATEWRRADG